MDFQKTIDRLKKVTKKQWGILVVAIIMFLGISYGSGFANGNDGAKVPLENKKVTYKELISEIASKEEKLALVNEEIKNKIIEKNSIESDKEKLNSEINKNQKAFDEAMEINKNRESNLSEMKELETEISKKQESITAFETTIERKKSELAKIDQLIIEKQEAPIQLSAGTYFVGTDVPVGRYKAMPVGRGSNFAVYDSSGRLEVNTILGVNGEPEYIFFVLDGAKIESRSGVKLIPVE